MFARIRRWFARPRFAEALRNATAAPDFGAHGITMFDRVCIRENDDPIAHTLAGQCGIVYGETTPSVSAVNVIGDSHFDYAVNVCLDRDSSTAWYAVELLEFLERGIGTTIKVGESSFTLRADGGWDGPT